MADFTQFKSTTLVGKNDLPLGSSVVKIPIDNLTIHEYITQPIRPSTSNLTTQILTKLDTIDSLASYEKYDAVEKFTETLSKDEASLSEA